MFKQNKCFCSYLRVKEKILNNTVSRLQSALYWLFRFPSFIRIEPETYIQLTFNLNTSFNMMKGLIILNGFNFLLS